MTTIVCLGLAVQDMIFSLPKLPRGPGKLIAQDRLEVGGGVAATAAVAVARLGGSASLITRLGDDVLGDGIVAELESYGVDMSQSRRFPGHRSPMSAVLVDSRGERLIVNHADPDLPGETDWLAFDALDSADAVLADPRWPEGAVALFRAARKRGLPAVLDADRAMENTSPIEAATHVVFSADGLRGISGQQDLDAGLHQLALKTGGFLAVTDGANGVSWLADDMINRMPGFDIDVVDTTGAGDVFHGAFALALGEGRSEEEALHFASASAALKCTQLGGRPGIPDRQTVDQFMRRTG